MSGGFHFDISPTCGIIRNLQVYSSGLLILYMWILSLFYKNIPHDFLAGKSWKINIFVSVIVIQCIYFTFPMLNQYSCVAWINIEFHNLTVICKNNFFPESWKEILYRLLCWYNMSKVREVERCNIWFQYTYCLTCTSCFLSFVFLCVICHADLFDQTPKHYVTVWTNMGGFAQ